MGETFSVKVEQDQARIDLLPILDMSAADKFLEVMRECVTAQKFIVLNGKDVERISTPCVQVMLASALAVEKNGGSLTIENISSDFERAMRELGLSEYLKNWSKN